MWTLNRPVLTFVVYYLLSAYILRQPLLQTIWTQIRLLQRKHRSGFIITAENHVILKQQQWPIPLKTVDSGNTFFNISVNNGQICMGYEANILAKWQQQAHCMRLKDKDLVKSYWRATEKFGCLSITHQIFVRNSLKMDNLFSLFRVFASNPMPIWLVLTEILKKN